MATKAKPTENRAGQEKGATAADVAGPESTPGPASGTVTAPQVVTHTDVEVPVRETAGPLGAHYVTGPDGAPVAVDAPAQPATGPSESAAPAVAVVDTESPANPGPSLVPQEHVTVVHEVIPGVPATPVFANPGPPTAAPEGSEVARATPDPEE